VLSHPAYQTITFHTQIKLIQLCNLDPQHLTERENDFMKNHASCDFVIYFNVGKRPIGVIEVDGETHNTSTQQERDNLKNKILEKIGLPILRLKTIESHIEQKIENFLAQSISISNQFNMTI
jgi:very-short-patch-repair endonuclease